AAERQRHAAMRTALLQQADLAVAVAERDQPLAEDLDPHRIAVALRDLLAEADRMPEAPEHLAHRRARADATQQLVIGFRQHWCSSLQGTHLAPNRCIWDHLSAGLVASRK